MEGNAAAAETVDETAAPRRLSMTVVGHDVRFHREPSAAPDPPTSTLQVIVYVRGATDARHNNKPIKRVLLAFAAQGSSGNHVGDLFEVGGSVAVLVTLDREDFPGVWATLQLGRGIRLECDAEQSSNRVRAFRLDSQGDLFQALGV